jgi:5-methylcytosine-specific restriction endonuclease McrA
MPKGVYNRTLECRKSLSISHLGKSYKSRGQKRPSMTGENHWHWMGGAKKREYRNKYNIERRHRLGISKRYNYEMGVSGATVSYTKEYKRAHRKKYKAQRKMAGDLPISRIQMVYEDNIKKYGTLTCYLCELPIAFGNDELEHKIPISRGGTNEFYNLSIACKSCNCKKRAKTEEEYRRIISNA